MRPEITPPRRGAPVQVRFFRDTDLNELEQAVNGWLGERTDREIVEIRQSVASGGMGYVVSVWYIEE